METRCHKCLQVLYYCPVCLDQFGVARSALICKNAKHPTHTCEWVAPDSVPPLIERGAANDEKAKTDSVLNGMAVQNVKSCPTVCPSCEKNSALSKLDMVMSRFETGDLPPHPQDYLTEDRKFGGSDAHAIVSQTLLRDHTRTFLTQFLDRNVEKLGSRSPCVFQSDGVWEAFESDYIQGMVDEASQSANEEKIANWIAEKAKKERRAKLNENLDRLKGWQHVWDAKGDTAPKKGGEESAPSEKRKLTPNYYPPDLEHRLNAKQEESKENFIRRDVTMYAITFTIAELPDQEKIEFTVTNPKLASDWKPIVGKTVIKRKVCDSKGTTISYVQQKFDFGISKPVKNLMVAKQRLVRDAWVGMMFSNIMGSPFTKGTQCRYCEELQRDESVVQRYEYWSKNRTVTPKEYVGKVLIKEIESLNGGDARAYVANWMKGVAAELKKRILQECKLEEAKKTPSGSEPNGADGGMAQVENPHSAEEMDKAIGAALKDIEEKRKAFTKNMLIGITRKYLGSNKTIDSRALAQLVQAKLDVMVGSKSLTCNKNQYSFTKS
jgi:hypothetical protein